MEIERKFLVKQLPNLNNLKFKNVSQGYLNFQPEIRVRSMNNTEFYLTQKSDGTITREEIETSINETTFNILSNLINGRIVSKTRYYIPLGLETTAELDIYSDELNGLSTIEIEFKTEEQALNFNIPDWFGKEVTFDKKYKNKNLARCSDEDLRALVTTSDGKTLDLKM